MKRFFLPVIVLLMASGCCKKGENNTAETKAPVTISVEDDNMKVVTKLIRYNVSVRNEGDGTGFDNNIPAKDRFPFTGMLLENVLNGKVQAYTSDNKPARIEDIKAALSVEKEIVKNEGENQKAETKKIDMTEHIDRIAFIEEWRIDEATLFMKKNIKGVCPMIPVFLSDGSIAGYSELFWVYFDASFPAALQPETTEKK